MIWDICEPSDSGSAIFNECEVLSTREKACEHLRIVAENYKLDGIYAYLDSGDVGFDVETTKTYVMLESKDSFSFYTQGYYNENHIAVWIEEKEINKQGGQQ